MMIEPGMGKLLRRVSECMEASSGDSRQMRAGLWALRDLSKRVDGHPHAVREDIADMRAALGVGVGIDPGPALDGDEKEHVRLQHQLLALLQNARNDGQTQTRLRKLFLKMLERERALLGPLRGNPSLDAPR